jgi:alanine dehydrogenase
LFALLDDGVWNPYKTGAVAAVGTDRLAVDDASSVGIIGSGGIARASLETISTVRDIESVSVYSPTRSSRESFATDVTELLDIDASAVESSAEAISDVDIVIVATDASDPVIDGEHLSPGTHVNAMGAAHPKRELDVTTFDRASKYVPDIQGRVFGHSVQERFRAASGFLEAFDQNKASENLIHGELGQLVGGDLPGRTERDEITILDSVGTAIETVSAAYMLYERAVAADCGTPLRHAPRHEITEE